MRRQVNFSLTYLVAGMCLWAVPVLATAQDRPPEVLSPVAASQSTLATIRGAIQDSSGGVIPGAAVHLLNDASAVEAASHSDASGSFRFAAVEPGTYRIAVEARGFAAWTSASIAVHPGESCELPPLVLQVADVSITVDVALSRHDIAEEQLKAEERQRLNGLIPNFKVSYDRNAAPLTAGQKFRLAWATTIDPATFLVTGAIAGYEQAHNNIRGYGQGVYGYAKRYGANYADAFSSEMIGTAMLPSLLHQDPRYFYKGTGSIFSRALYAIASTFVCRGDNGRWQPNYSSMIGSVAAGGISNPYYPSSSQGALLTVNNALLDYGIKSVGNLFQEFLYRQITPSAPKNVATEAHLILHDGTPISLILTEDLDFQSAEKGQSVVFALADDVKANGVIVAKRGCKAFGGVANAALNSDGKPVDLEVRIKYLQVADDQVMLRASKLKEGGTGVLLHRSREAGGPEAAVSGTRIPAGTLATVYVVGDASLNAAR